MDGKRNVRGRLYPLTMRVRWTRRERDTVRGRAAEAGRSVSRYLVEAATRENGAALVARLTPDQIAELELLAFQVRKIGVNLNQLARRENEADYGTADPPTDEEIAAAVREVRDVCARIIDVLVYGGG
jgi:hypothetical protein